LTFQTCHCLKLIIPNEQISLKTVFNFPSFVIAGTGALVICSGPAAQSNDFHSSLVFSVVSFKEDHNRAVFIKIRPADGYQNKLRFIMCTVCPARQGKELPLFNGRNFMKVSVYLRTTVPRSYRGTCRLHVGVSMPGTSELLATQTGDCSEASHRFTGLSPTQVYRVCAIIQVSHTATNFIFRQKLLNGIFYSR
jgi:hypothetical protein